MKVFIVCALLLINSTAWAMGRLWECENDSAGATYELSGAQSGIVGHLSIGRTDRTSKTLYRGFKGGEQRFSDGDASYVFIATEPVIPMQESGAILQIFQGETLIEVLACSGR